MTRGGATHAGLTAAVNSYNQAAATTNEAMANEFSEICNGHVDYLWNRLLRSRRAPNRRRPTLCLVP